MEKPKNQSKDRNILIAFKKCPNPDVMEVHVNFDLWINPELYFIIKNIEGVQSLGYSVQETFLDRYEFSVVKGFLFDWEPIKEAIKEKIGNHFR